MENPVFRVSDFLASINQTLEYAYPVVAVVGEVTSFKVNQGKYVFFDLKDESGSVGCFMTVWQLRTPIEDGMKIVVTANPKVTQWGKFSLTVQSLKPVGEGDLRKSFELLRKKLESEGLFDPGRKRILPSVPRRVAVVSSTQAAGYGDFIKILESRWGGLDIEVAHTQVQGEAAADQMIRAVRYFNEQADLADVLVLIRGGGSADDLAAYNDERLVREIAGSRIPTLVGVGHEVDVSLADMVADVRAATPSNAAQLLVPDRRDVIATVWDQVRSMASVTERSIDRYVVDDKVRLGRALERIDHYTDRQIETVHHIVATLRAYDPRAILERGYALMRGSPVVGATVTIETSKQLITAEVKDVNQK